MSLQFGRFELLERIGVGGMAEVWKARVGGIGGFEKIVVVKKILPAFAQNKTFIEMLLAEARLCAVLHHTNVVQTYENGEIEGQYYIAMEYVSGHDLFKVLSRATSVNRRLPVEICLYIAAEVAKGLSYAHGAKDIQGRPLHIIHRDVSPSNVLISETGEVKVMDFGVAKAQLDGQNRDGQSRAGVLKGKLGYMSPEQVTGRDFDHRSDIFSLGIMLYESITLKRLFLGRTDLETLVAIRDARIEHKFRKHEYIDEPVRVILRRALAREPAERYASALDMHDDIVQLLFEHKTHVSNRSLAGFLTDLFDPALQPHDPTSQNDDNAGPPPVLPAPTLRAQPRPTAPAGEPPAVSLSFSPDEIRRQREEIARRREAESAGQQGVGVVGASAAPAAGQVAADTTQVELGGVPSRRPSRVKGSAGIDFAVLHAETTDPGSAPEMQPQEPGQGRPSSPSLPMPMHPGAPRFGATEADAASVRRGSGERPSGDRLRSVPHRPYYLRTGDGHTIGPMAEGALVEMIRSRSVVGDDVVSLSGGPFQRLADVTALRRVWQNVVGARGAPLEAGPLSRLTFPGLIVRLFSDRFTGDLELRRDDAVKQIFLRRGRPQHVASNQQSEMLGAFLAAQGIIAQQDVDMALEQALATGRRFGDILVGMNLIKPHPLYQVLDRQFRSMFLDAFQWDAATYALYPDEQLPADTVALDLDPIAALVEGVRLHLPLSLLEPHFDPWLDAPYRRTRNAKVSIESLRLQAREAKALGMLLSCRTLREVVDERCKGRQQKLAILQVLFLLLQVDLITFDA